MDFMLCFTEIKILFLIKDSKRMNKQLLFVILLGFFVTAHSLPIFAQDSLIYMQKGDALWEERGVLSLTPMLPEEVLKSIAERLEANGYNFSKFKMTNQTDFSCVP
jgi:hypothetical protein